LKYKVRDFNTLRASGKEFGTHNNDKVDEEGGELPEIPSKEEEEELHVKVSRLLRSCETGQDQQVEMLGTVLPEHMDLFFTRFN